MYRFLALSVLALSYACGQQQVAVDPAAEYQISAQTACDSADISTLPERASIEVPYVEEEPNYCGPASLSMVMGFYGKSVDQSTIGSDIVGEKGVTIDNLVDKAQSYGFDAFTGSCQFNGLLGFLAEGKPVIARVLSNEGTNGHFIVVTGYDNSLGVLYVNDPAQPNRLTVTFDEFSEMWNITTLGDNNSANIVIIVSPTNLPTN
jgi:ABC-type bacteriocin/lantibiotic exporter with double-glycine peptidase domain